MTIDDIPFFNIVRSQSYEYLHDSTNYTLEQNIEWFNKTNPKFFIVSVDGKDIGYFRTSDWTPISVMIGMDIDPKYRGNGYAQEAYRLFIKHLKCLGINTVYLEVLEYNTRAKHIYDKLGFIVTNIEPYKNTNTIKMKLDI